MVKAVAIAALVLLVAGSLDEVLREVEGVYGRMNDLRADFTQTAFNKSLNQTIPAKGTVYLKKGGKLRWEFTEPTPQESPLEAVLRELLHRTQDHSAKLDRLIHMAAAAKA